MAANPVEPDPALHRSLPDLLRNLLRNPVDSAPKPSRPSPEPSSETLLNLTWLCTKAFGQVQQGSGEGSGEGLGGFGAELRQVQRGSGEGSGEGVGGFGAEPGQVQQGSAEGSGVLGQIQVRFNKVLERRFRSGEGRRSVRLWCRARSGSTAFQRRFRRRCGGLWCRARSGSTAFQRRFRRSSGRLKEVPEKVLEKVPEGLGAARFNEASSSDCGSVSA